MKTPMTQVDSFTSEPFRGNPAAVCLIEQEMSESWMQSVATEMNLSETAFPVPKRKNEYGLRWFTPATEVPLCGHATLATAHVLWESGLATSDEPIRFHSKSGVLIARREGDWICLDFPAYTLEEIPLPAGLAEALGAKPTVVFLSNSGKWLAELESETVVRQLTPDFGRLGNLECLGCIVTAPGESPSYDFVSRFFAPRLGINEDPVTGAAHCCLAPYWTGKFGKNELIGQQVSKREGTVEVRMRGERVDLLGRAVTVLRGELLC
jgi:PhzF family phenazine biosynthesis protein